MHKNSFIATVNPHGPGVGLNMTFDACILRIVLNEFAPSEYSLGAKFSYCDFFSVPKNALWEDLVYTVGVTDLGKKYTANMYSF